jgi:hypothetical protein
MRKENCKGEEHDQLSRDPLGGHSLYVRLTRAVLCNCTASRQSTLATTGTIDTWEKLAHPHTAASATTRYSENRYVSTGSQFD